ncbi:MAG: HD domain-containing protein [Lachnospiraceae bacterium]|nr:HD domain-containing protein [Lachnospiraceae bacterium]
MIDGILIRRAIEYIEALFAENAGGHDAAHSIRVYRNAVEIASKEAPCDMTVVSLAAILHDADDHKLFDTENNENARAFLKTSGIPNETIDEICHVINAVSFSRNRGKKPQTLEGQIVQDADRLDALGAVGIARTFAYGGEHGRSMEESVQHFYDKLLLIKEELGTDTAREMAEKRHTFLESFLVELKEELNATSA